VSVVLFEKALRRKHVVCMIPGCPKLPTWYVMARRIPSIKSATPTNQGVELSIEPVLEVHAFCCDDHQSCVADELREQGIKYLLRPYRPWIPRWVLQALILVVMLVIAIPMLFFLGLKALAAKLKDARKREKTNEDRGRREQGLPGP